MFKKLQKVFSLATLLVASCFTASAAQVAVQENDNEKLMLFTDLHYLSPALMNNGGTTLQKEIDGDNKMFDKASDVLNAIISKALAEKPAGVLIPGDLTKNGEKYSHNEVAAALQQLVDAGIKVWVVPGNHDVNNTNARSFAGGMSRTIASPTSSEFA
ncbi:MAG: metallophosphoesterase, partial [Bacteroidales bacterium]|nr:metallophosphoesterase [Candidatus Sodaliphilus fimicaballi]